MTRNEIQRQTIAACLKTTQDVLELFGCHVMTMVTCCHDEDGNGERLEFTFEKSDIDDELIIKTREMLKTIGDKITNETIH